MCLLLSNTTLIGREELRGDYGGLMLIFQQSLINLPKPTGTAGRGKFHAEPSCPAHPGRGRGAHRATMGASPSRSALGPCWETNPLPTKWCWWQEHPSLQLPGCSPCSPALVLLVKGAPRGRNSSTFFHLLFVALRDPFWISLSFSVFCQLRQALQTWGSNFFLASRQIRNSCTF